MIITNLTNTDYWFGPMHLPAGSGQTLNLDDTSDTALYLLNDEVADAVNTLFLTSPALITVTSYAMPFPRPTGIPSLLHGDGSPQGMVYAPQGSLYMRRDSTAAATSLFTKTTGVTVNTGWVSIVTAAVPSGTIVAYAGSTVPTGWFFCQGQAVSRSTYSNLFTAIGTTYGSGDGSTTFNLPDLQGRIPVGLGSNADVSTLANNDGLSEASRSPKHNHTAIASTMESPRFRGQVVVR